MGALMTDVAAVHVQAELERRTKLEQKLAAERRAAREAAAAAAAEEELKRQV